MRRWAGAAAAFLAAAPASAAGIAAAPPGASSCSGCHAASVSDGPPPIQGRPADEIAAAMAAFRTGSRPATLMNRIATGFTEPETRAIAVWLSAQEGPR